MPTPTPVSVSVPDDDPSKLRWMVDVEVQGWRPARHPALGSEVLRGSVVSDHDVRTSAHGASFFGLGPFVQAFLGLEGSTARPRLRPRTVGGQVADVLQPLGWEVSLSDKGAYAIQSARLFGNHPPQFTTMRRPGIASVSGDTVILDGATMEELERYHVETLRHVLRKVNVDVAEHEREERAGSEREAEAERHHEQTVKDISGRLKFDQAFDIRASRRMVTFAWIRM